MAERLINTAASGEPAATTTAFQQLLNRADDLGVSDLSEQHDHYLYGSDKR